LDLTSWDVTVKVVSPKQMVDTEAMAEEFELAMRSFECTLLGNCGLFNENGHPLNYIFGDRYDFTKGFEATLAAAVTLSAAHTANIEAVNVNKGMAGQVIEITGTGFENDLEPTDKNWYKNMFGFFNRREKVQAYVGDRQCRTHFYNDTFLNCTVFYDRTGTTHDINLITYGKGWSNTSATYTFALDIYDISPKEGSISGGTVITAREEGSHRRTFSTQDD